MRLLPLPLALLLAAFAFDAPAASVPCAFQAGLETMVGLPCQEIPVVIELAAVQDSQLKADGSRVVTIVARLVPDVPDEFRPLFPAPGGTLQLLGGDDLRWLELPLTADPLPVTSDPTGNSYAELTLPLEAGRLMAIRAVYSGDFYHPPSEGFLVVKVVPADTNPASRRFRQE